MDKERTEGLRSDVAGAHGRRKEGDIRVNPKSQVIGSGEEK